MGRSFQSKIHFSKVDTWNHPSLSKCTIPGCWYTNWFEKGWSHDWKVEKKQAPAYINSRWRKASIRNQSYQIRRMFIAYSGLTILLKFISIGIKYRYTDIGSVVCPFVLIFARSTNVVQLSNRYFRCHHPLLTQLILPIDD